MGVVSGPLILCSNLPWLQLYQHTPHPRIINKIFDLPANRGKLSSFALVSCSTCSYKLLYVTWWRNKKNSLCISIVYLNAEFVTLTHSSSERTSEHSHLKSIKLEVVIRGRFSLGIVQITRKTMTVDTIRHLGCDDILNELRMCFAMS